MYVNRFVGESSVKVSTLFDSSIRCDFVGPVREPPKLGFKNSSSTLTHKTNRYEYVLGVCCAFFGDVLLLTLEADAGSEEVVPIA